MEAFLLYISDWLSSKSIAQMDGDEERGYLRLLLHAASQDDCGLEKDEKKLAILSLLDEQWIKESPVWKYQFGVSSGQKLLACFFEVKDGKPVNAATGESVEISPKSEVNLQELKPGRIYNERLLKCLAEYKRRQAKASAAAKKLWAGKKAQASEMDAPSIAPACLGNATRVENENKSENENSSTLPSKKEEQDAVAQKLGTVVEMRRSSPAQSVVMQGSIAVNGGPIPYRPSSFSVSSAFPPVNPPAKPKPISEKAREQWTQERWMRHPKKRGDLLEAYSLLDGVYDQGPEERERFDRHHVVMCQSFDWLKNGAKFCPKLTDYIKNKQYYEPLPEDVKEPEPTLVPATYPEVPEL